MDERRAYAEMVKTKLDEWNRAIDDLEHRIDDFSEARKTEIRRELSTARNRRDELVGDLARLRNVSQDTWNEVKAEIDEAWNGIRSALERAAERAGG